MASGEPTQEVHPKSGPWVGVDETGAGGPDRLVGALNLVHKDGITSRRPGRRILATASGGRRINGIFEYVDSGGGRRLIVLADPSSPVSGTDAKAYYLQERDASLVELVLPVVTSDLPAGRSSSGVAFEGHLLLADCSGRLLDYDGYAFSALQAFDGLNAGTSFEAFLQVPPRASLLDVWRNRLVVAGDPGHPGSIGLSEDNQNALTVPPTAPVGGPNVWPGSTQFALLTGDGDVPVGMTVFNDRLIVLGRSSISVVDEDSVSPNARIIARQHGCIAPKSVVNTGQTVLYLGDRTILGFDGVNAIPISGPVHRTLQRYVDWEQAVSAVGLNVRQEKEYRLWLPILGDTGNRLMVGYNYEKGTWRIAASWYLFDSLARRQATYQFDVTAACTYLVGGNREIVITGDSQGNLWLEDTGCDDQGVAFPAYAMLTHVEAGAEVETFRDAWVDCLHDGSLVGILALIDGRSEEQEIGRMLDGTLITDPTQNDIPLVVARALKAAQLTWASAAAWPIDVVGPQYDDLKLGYSARGRKIQPVILLPGSSGGVTDPAPGGLRQIELGVRSRDGRRT